MQSNYQTHLASGEVPVTYEDLPDGFAGTDATVHRMNKAAMGIYGAKSPKIRALAINILRQFGVKQKDYEAEAVALGYWVRDNIRYVRDPHGQETLSYPEELAFNTRAGDCLDGSTRLLTPAGYKAIRDVQVGDTIYGKDGWTKVIQKWDKGFLDVEEYFLDNGRSFVATRDHLCILADGSETKAGDIQIGSALLTPNSKPVRLHDVYDAGNRHVYDIETEDHGIYLPDADVVVHNCDDQSTLLAALLGSVGIPSRFKVMGSTPMQYSHVYLQARPKDKWITMDPIMEDKPIGWEVPQHKRVIEKAYQVNVAEGATMQGLGYVGDPRVQSHLEMPIIPMGAGTGRPPARAAGHPSHVVMPSGLTSDADTSPMMAFPPNQNVGEGTAEAALNGRFGVMGPDYLGSLPAHRPPDSMVVPTHMQTTTVAQSPEGVDFQFVQPALVVESKSKDKVAYDGSPSLAVRTPARALTNLGEDTATSVSPLSPLIKLAGIAALIAGGLYFIKRKR